MCCPYPVVLAHRGPPAGSLTRVWPETWGCGSPVGYSKGVRKSGCSRWRSGGLTSACRPPSDREGNGREGDLGGGSLSKKRPSPPLRRATTPESVPGSSGVEAGPGEPTSGQPCLDGAGALIPDRTPTQTHLLLPSPATRRRYGLTMLADGEPRSGRAIASGLGVHPTHRGVRREVDRLVATGAIKRGEDRRFTLARPVAI